MRFVFVCLLVVVSLSVYSQEQNVSFFWKRKYSNDNVSFKVLGRDTSIVTPFRKASSGVKVCTYTTDSMRYVIRIDKKNNKVTVLDSTDNVMIETKVVDNKIVWVLPDGSQYSLHKKSGRKWEYLLAEELVISSTFNRQGGKHIAHTIKKSNSPGLGLLVMYSNVRAIDIMRARGTRAWLYSILVVGGIVKGILTPPSTPEYQ